MKYILIYIGFVGLNVLIAWVNNQTRQRRLNHHNYKQICHPAWGFYYCCACLVPYVFLHSPVIMHIWIIPIKMIWALPIALLFQHLCFFPVAWNVLAETPSIFFLSRTSSAWTDKIMVRIGLKSTEIVNFAAMIISFTFLTLTIVLS